MIELEQKLRAAMHAAVGDEQPPRDLTARVLRRHRRRTAVVASLSVAASAAVVIAVLLAALPSRGGAPVGPRSGPSPQGLGHPTSKLRGAAMPPGSDVRLLVDGPSQTGWYSTATRQIVQIAGLPPTSIGYGIRRIDGGYIARAAIAGPACCDQRPVYYVADGAKTATGVGLAAAAAPASVAGAVWLTYHPRHGPSRAQLTGLDGRPIGAPVTLPAGKSAVMAGVGSYLLLSPLGDLVPGTRERLWDPASRRVIRTFGQVDAIGPEQIAWGGACVGCPVHVLDVRTGATFSIAIPRGSRVFVDGTLGSDEWFSSDGTLLAVKLTHGTYRHMLAGSEQLAVIDLATRRLVMLPGVDIGSGTSMFLGFGWQPGTHRLVVILRPLNPHAATQVGYWQPGAARLRITTARLPPRVWAILVQ